MELKRHKDTKTITNYKNIFAIRKEKGITQEVIADALCVDTSVVSNLDNVKADVIKLAFGDRVLEIKNK